MRNFRKFTPLFYVLLVALTIWLVGPVMAGGGDPDAARQAWPMIEAGTLVIDVRSPEEYASGHLDGAINIEWHDSDAIARAIGANTTRQVVVYCRSGNRANKAISKMQALGYTNIYNATGYEALKETQP